MGGMLELKNIRFDVDDDAGHVDILKDVSFTIPEGKFVVITGPNGGGKSTIAKLIAGVRMPTGGQILFDGQDITALSITERAKLGISYALQQPVRFKGIQVIDLLRIAAARELSVAESCDYLSRVGLCARDYINREVNASLSGGELKRIEIATILARSTRLSVFDEPEAGIDLWSFQSLIRVFEEMRRSIAGSSILVISHQERILEIADEVIVVSDGRISRQGPRAEVLPELIGTPSALTGCERLQERG
jgi:Fe-S cluster assembly ATP-binding protein